MSRAQIAEMQRCARSLHALGLAPTGGIVAMRTDGAHVLLGARETAFDALAPEDVVRLGTHEGGEYADILGIFAARSDLAGLFLLQSPFGTQVSRLGIVMHASLDDTTQIAGGRIRTAASLKTSDVLRCIRRNYGCFVEGIGQLTVGRSLHEAYVAALVLEKGARAQVQAAPFGGAKPLSAFDRALMRAVYLRKYSRIQEQRL